MSKRPEEIPTEDDIHLANKYFKRYSTSYIFGKLQIKTARWNLKKSFRISEIQNTDNIKC